MQFMDPKTFCATMGSGMVKKQIESNKACLDCGELLWFLDSPSVYQHKPDQNNTPYKRLYCKSCKVIFELLFTAVAKYDDTELSRTISGGHDLCCGETNSSGQAKDVEQ